MKNRERQGEEKADRGYFLKHAAIVFQKERTVTSILTSTAREVQPRLEVSRTIRLVKRFISPHGCKNVEPEPTSTVENWSHCNRSSNVILFT